MIPPRERPPRPRRRYAVRIPPAPPGAEVPGQRELTAVGEVVHAFLSADRPEEAFQFALDRVAPVVGASLASVYLVEGASELMRLVAAHNWPERHRPWLAEVRVRLGFGPSGEATSERRMIEVPDVFADPDLEDWQEIARELGFRALVALPLRTGQGPVGAVTFYFRDWSDFTAERRGMLRLVADLMAAAAEKSRLLDRVRRAEAAAVEALGELDRQYIAVSDARRSARGFVAAAAEALQPPLEALAAGSPAATASAALQVLGDLVLITDIADGIVEAGHAPFDPRDPLREAIAAVSLAMPASRFVAHEPAQELDPAGGDETRLTTALARLLARAARGAAGGDVPVSVSVSGGRVEYRVPGSAGDDVAWRIASAITALLGGTLDVESVEGHPTAVLSLPVEGATERSQGARSDS